LPPYRIKDNVKRQEKRERHYGKCTYSRGGELFSASHYTFLIRRLRRTVLTVASRWRIVSGNVEGELAMKSHTHPALFSGIFFVALAATLFTAEIAFAATLYVAAEGNDAWSGTCDGPNAAWTDGPKATILGARDAIRAMRAASALTDPLVFDPEDSGGEAAPIAYAASPDTLCMIRVSKLAASSTRLLPFLLKGET
jgi:hypothetical protein